MKRIYSGVTVEYQNETDYNQSNVVYLITFPNGKYYVGSTKNKLSTRISTHIANSRTPNSKAIIHEALRKFNTFNVCVLDSLHSKIDLLQSEEKYTLNYKSNEEEYGYNIKWGNRFVTKDETKKLISQKLKNHTVSEYSRIKNALSKGGTPFIDSNGDKYNTLREAAYKYNVPVQTIWQYLKTGKYNKSLKTSFHYVNLHAFN